MTIAAGGGGVIAADDELSIGANATALNGGTIKDAGTNTASTITNCWCWNCCWYNYSYRIVTYIIQNNMIDEVF